MNWSNQTPDKEMETTNEFPALVLLCWIPESTGVQQKNLYTDQILVSYNKKTPNLNGLRVLGTTD